MGRGPIVGVAAGIYHHGVKVLIVDDAVAIRVRLAAMVGEINARAEVREAGCADDAVSIARWFSPDIVLLDIHMPGGSGLDALPSIKRHAPSSVVIVLTNATSESLRRDSLARGADHFFDKSIDVDRLLEILSALTDSAQPTDPPSPDS